MMAGETELHRDIGVLQGRLSALEQQVRDNQQRNEATAVRFEETQRAMALKLDAVHDAVISAKGGARTLIATGTVGATIGAAVTTILQYLRGG